MSQISTTTRWEWTWSLVPGVEEGSHPPSPAGVPLKTPGGGSDTSWEPFSVVAQASGPPIVYWRRPSSDNSGRRTGSYGRPSL